MLPILTNLKTQLQANKAKSALLGALLCVAAFLGLRGFLTPHPQTSAAAPMIHASNTPLTDADPEASQLSPKELKDKLAQSKALWQVLREKRGVAPGQAFAFDPAYYNLDPSAVPPKVEPVVVAQVTQAPAEKLVPQAPPVPDEHAKALAIKEQSKGLVLQSTVLGSRPGAIINAGVFHLDDHVGGFRVVAIRAREVIVEKDGITLAIEMAK
jgi:hypothetical protein